LKIGPIRCPETSVKSYHSTLRNTPEERTSHQHCGGSLKSLDVCDAGSDVLYSICSWGLGKSCVRLSRLASAQWLCAFKYGVQTVFNKYEIRDSHSDADEDIFLGI
jgi:hypothetical protein